MRYHMSSFYGPRAVNTTNTLSAADTTATNTPERRSFSEFVPSQRFTIIGIVLILLAFIILSVIAAVCFFRKRGPFSHCGSCFERNRNFDIETGHNTEQAPKTFLKRHLDNLRAWKKPAPPVQAQPQTVAPSEMTEVPLTPVTMKYTRGRSADHFANYMKNKNSQKDSYANPRHDSGEVSNAGGPAPRGQNGEGLSSQTKPYNPYMWP